MGQHDAPRARPAAHAALLTPRGDELLRVALDGIYGIDLCGRTTFVNEAAARLTGYSPRELIGQPMHELIHHTRANGRGYVRSACPIYAAFQDGVVHAVDDEVFWRKDGTSFPVTYTRTPVLRGGRLVGALVAFRDLSDQRAAERSLLRAQQELTRLRARLGRGGQTVFMITHDVDEAIYLADRVLLMSCGPHARIAAEFTIELPRPRERMRLVNDPTYLALRARMLEFLIGTAQAAPSAEAAPAAPAEELAEVRALLEPEET